jgi:hypothetical protein
MRRPILGLAATVAFAVLALTGPAYGQLGVGADPFSFYYGYYLPHAAAMAARPTPLDSINQVTAQRQYTAQTDRSALYDPISPYAEEEDQFGGRGGGRGGARGLTGGGNGRPQMFRYGKDNSNSRGEGPGMYYGRAASYFPTLREGRGANANIAKEHPHRGFSRGGGMGGGMGMGMPGMGIR